MTRKDFELIARTISNLRGITGHDREFITDQFAVALARANPRFDKVRFRAACRREGEGEGDSAF